MINIWISRFIKYFYYQNFQIEEIVSERKDFEIDFNCGQNNTFRYINTDVYIL